MPIMLEGFSFVSAERIISVQSVVPCPVLQSQLYNLAYCLYLIFNHILYIDCSWLKFLYQTWLLLPPVITDIGASTRPNLRESYVLSRRVGLGWDVTVLEKFNELGLGRIAEDPRVSATLQQKWYDVIITRL